MTAKISKKLLKLANSLSLTHSFSGIKIQLKYSVRLHMWRKVPNSVSFLALNPPKPSYVLKCIYIDPRFISYHLGNTEMDYLPKENIAVKNSWLHVSLTLGHLLALPPPGWEKPLSVVEWWGLERRWARWPSLCSLWHPPLLWTTSEDRTAAENPTCTFCKSTCEQEPF